MKQALLDYGLSDNEAEIYLICLKIGEGTANRIAELANLPRTTVYGLLERLKQLGLVTSYVQENKTRFMATDPNSLIRSLDQKKEKIKEILPDLKKIHNSVGEKPVIEVYHGNIALIKLLDEILDHSSSLKLIGNVQAAVERIGYHPDKFRMKRRQRKIPIRQIQEQSSEAQRIKEDTYTKVRFLHSLQKTRESTFIAPDCVYHLILLDEITALKIKSKEHAMALSIMFEELWEKSSK